MLAPQPMAMVHYTFGLPHVPAAGARLLPYRLPHCEDL